MLTFTFWLALLAGASVLIVWNLMRAPTPGGAKLDDSR